ncbi:MAG: type III polyketide synthase [Actinobacteria bacterium]|nr:type III polyketide synthase [Actinomycetota bacterium]
MSVIASVHGVLGAHRYSQEEITGFFSKIVAPQGKENALIDRIHKATEVKYRSLVLSADGYDKLDNFGAANDAFIRIGLELGADAILSALETAGLSAKDVDFVMATSVTGVATPSLEARLVPIVGFRPDIKRVPIFGLGCVAGAAGIARLHDYLLGHPDDVAVLLSVELCSLTLQSDDVSMANIVSSGLFGDGAAAVVMVGKQRAERMGITGPRVIASRSRMYPDTEDTMGWDIGSSGFRIVLSASLSSLVEKYLGDDVDGFLHEQGLEISDIAQWVCHTGGPKVLQAIEKSLELHEGQLAVSWNSLAESGNLSSASVLHVLRDVLERRGVDKPEPGTPGLLMAMGPGFCSELVLLEW